MATEEVQLSIHSPGLHTPDEDSDSEFLMLEQALMVFTPESFVTVISRNTCALQLVIFVLLNFFSPAHNRRAYG